MPDILPTPIKFFVNIIESPSPQDYYYGRYEGSLLHQAISLNNIPCVVRNALSRETFEYALTYDLLNVLKMYPNMSPILHISAHGSEHGIGLTSNEIIDWKTFRKLITPLSNALNGNLLICMSSCKGTSACRMAMSLDDENEPFYAIIGNSQEPTWADTAVAYASFYHLIAKGYYLVDAIAAMKHASGNDNFVTISAAAAKHAYIEAINESKNTSIQSDLNSELQQSGFTVKKDFK